MNRMLSIVVILLLVGALGAEARTLTADCGITEPTHGYNWIGDRLLINDGSFEGGSCLTTPIWTCTTDNSCDWITDIVPIGLWNYDGIHVVWLGGFCGGIATEYTSICQDVFIGGSCPPGLMWFWMAYVNEGGSRVTLTIDGQVYYEYIIVPEDHLLDYQMMWVNTPTNDTFTVCFNYERNGAAGDNYFLDWVESAWGPTATREGSFSTFKSLY